MNSENTPKEVVKLFIDLANMTIGLMDEKQEPSIQQELEGLFPSTRGAERGEVKVESIIGLVQVNNLFLQQLIQVLVLQHCLPQNV